jgi:hypothetical protein
MIAFIEVLLTLLLPIALTFGSFMSFMSGFLRPLPLLFIMAVLLLGTGGAGGFTVAL